MTEYTFPFHTCETPNTTGVAQPYSAFINVVNCAIIMYFLLQTTKPYTFLLLFTILCLEAFHTFSHSIHIPGFIQLNITHMLSYCINIAFLLFFYHYVKKIPKGWFIMFYLLLIVFDIYAFCNMNVVYYIFSQALLFLSVLFYYYSYLPKTIQSKIHTIFFIVLSIILLFINERYNCKNMLAFYPHFPYHSLIEIAGIFLFYNICSAFYKY